MPKRRAKPVSIPAAIAMWVVALALIGWGLFQAREFSRALQRETQKIAALNDADTLPASQPQPVDFEPIQQALLSTDPEFASLPPPQELTSSSQPVGTRPQDSESAVAAYLVAAEQAFQTNRIVDARSALNSALALLPVSSPKAANLRDQLASLNRDVFFGSDILPDDTLARIIAIESGDTFQKVAKKYALPVSLLAAINPSLRSNNLKLNTGIKIITGPFHLRVLKGEARADLFLRDLFITSFPLTIEEGNSLPRGAYRVQSESKIQVGSKVWIGFEPAEADSDLPQGWLYASAGPRRPTGRADVPTGLKFADADLAQLYNTLVESHSLIRVDP